jgi:CspA family cold shock protein
MDRNRASRGSQRRDRNTEGRSDFEEPNFFRRTSAADQGTDAVEGEVLWFNPAKGFGFVELADGTTAFLHARQLEAIGLPTVSEGAAIKVVIKPGEKGPQVSQVLEVGAAPASEGRPQKLPSAASAPGSEEVEGTVKRYNAEKGFGFIARNDGGKDIFVHASVMTRCGIPTLVEGQVVRLIYAEGPKGLEARSLRLV